MIADAKTVTPELCYIRPVSTYEVTGLPPVANQYGYVSDNMNTIIITKQVPIIMTTTNINTYETEYTNYKYAASLRFKSDMKKRKEFKLIFSDLFDMLSNKDIALYDSLLASINVNSSSMYVLQSLLRLSSAYKKELSNWESLLAATKIKYSDSQEYDVDKELKGLFA